LSLNVLPVYQVAHLWGLLALPRICFQSRFLKSLNYRETANVAERRISGNMLGNPLELGDILAKGSELELPASARERHLYVCGGTGVGKSKFLEHCIWQDIVKHQDSKCGLILFDPHGLVYENIMARLAYHGLKRPIVPIDLRLDDQIISYNLLRRKEGIDPSVIVSAFVDAMAHVWGAGNTDETPLFARWASVILSTLYQNDCTVSDLVHLLSRDDIRRAMIEKIERHSMARYAWQTAEQDRKEHQRQITSTLNRFNRLVEVNLMKAMFGQPDRSLDLLEALTEGQIILVNLSTKGGRVSPENARTFGTLLLTDLWTTAGTRGKKEQERQKPFYVYIDECQKFVTPTIAENLDQARGFGLHLTLANQFPKQFVNAGHYGQAMYDSILANATNKIVFRQEHPEDAKTLGQWLFMNTFDTDQVKLQLNSTKVVGYREEIHESRTTGRSSTHASGSGRGGGQFHGQSISEGSGGMNALGDDPLGAVMSSAESWNNAVADSSGESANWQESESEAETESESVTRSSMLRPIMGQEVSSVQYRSIDEQIFRAMQRLFDQEDRHFAIRFHGGPKAPLFVRTPTVPPAIASQKLVEEYRRRLMSELPFALPMTEALERLNGREHKLLAEIVDKFAADEPVTTKRRIN
jgi:hypothetical protein